MNKVVYAPQAKEDLTEICDYIALTLCNKPAARAFLQKVRKAVQTAAAVPGAGSPPGFPGASADYRFLLCGNYMIFYHAEEGTVFVDRILYGKRDYMTILFGSKLFEEPEE